VRYCPRLNTVTGTRTSDFCISSNYLFYLHEFVAWETIVDGSRSTVASEITAQVHDGRREINVVPFDPFTTEGNFLGESISVLTITHTTETII
jgi:hypothetical protein